MARSWLSELLVNKLDAIEGLSRDFEFTVELLADNATLELKDLQGKLLCVELVRQDGSLSHAIVEELIGASSRKKKGFLGETIEYRRENGLLTTYGLNTNELVEV